VVNDPNDDFADLEGGSTSVSPAHEDGPVSVSAFVLRVVEGKDAGRALSIDDATPSPVLVGTSPACVLRLTDPEVSRRHLAFEMADRRLRVTDLRSTNGTYAAGLAIVDALLAGGESPRIGATTLRIERVASRSAPELSAHTQFGRVLGASRAMRRTYPMLERLAGSTVPVVIEGETGTGKEVLAETLHACGPRAAQPFVVFDCTTVPPNLLESELFGHERGAFTGAVSSRRGVFEQAHLGTLLIDEIGDLDVSLQPKLLRAIERSEIRRVGSDKVIKVDVRLLAATRRNLDEEVQHGRFRDDLFYRLAVGRIELPPLRERYGDIRLLAQHFWTELGGELTALREDVLRRWESARWPGNVRELRNTVARQLAVGDLAPTSTQEVEPREPTGTTAPPPPSPADDLVARVIAEGLPLPLARLRVVKEFEQRYIGAVLERHGGNVARAAEASGIARRYFQLLRGGKRR
jgi:two-component system, NtrC family, response regulator HydG